MKQAAAIFLLGIFSFNIFGYRFVYDYLAANSDISLQWSLDNNEYDEADLLTIKQPVNLPYYTNSQNFQRLDGEVNIEGTIYKYVKCRIYKDSLEMLCIPHLSKMKIENSKEEFFKMVNDYQQAGNKKKDPATQKVFKSIMNEYVKIHDEISDTRKFLPASVFYYEHTPLLPKTFLKSSEQPPDTAFSA
jgi:hypothetical protein